MKGIFKQKRSLNSLLTILALLLILVQATIVLADDPTPTDGEQPAFLANTYASTDGNSTIHKQETTLDEGYFARNGETKGLEVTSQGLVLAPNQTSGTYVSGVIHSPLGYTTDIIPLWKTTLGAGSELIIETRMSTDDNTWSDWVGNPEAYYPVREDAHSGSLIWVESQSASLQFRVTIRAEQGAGQVALHSITLVFNDTNAGPTDATIMSEMAQFDTANHEHGYCSIDKPAVVSRTAWGCPDGQHSPRKPASYAPVTHIVIHHTATSNNPYQDWSRMVRSVWNYHTNVLWWGDVGYNYLIDPNGIIYEGRAGGDDVIGIHDTHNRGSMAIGFIGCYGNCGYLGLSNAQPSTAMLDSAVDLIAWKLKEKGIDPHSYATYHYLPNVPVIAGGRDVVSTHSPGDNLYYKLPWLRDTVAYRFDECSGSGEACEVADIRFDKSSYTIGETIHFIVELVDSNNHPLGGADVEADVVKTATNSNFTANAFDLIDLTGSYQGSYNNTDIAGLYRFVVTASDPTGQVFATCTAEETVSVTGVATPTPTPTPIVTVTPTPTSTPIPQGVLVEVDPETDQVPQCNTQESTNIRVRNVSDLRAVSIQVRYNPDQMDVIDADLGLTGTQVVVGNAFPNGQSLVVKNEVDTVNGIINFDATTLADLTINGGATFFTINWHPKNAGTSAITLDKNMQLVGDGNIVINPTLKDGTVTVTTGCTSGSGISGIVTLQGRSDYSGINVTTADGQTITTDDSGFFNLTNGDSLTISYPGYLVAAASPNTAQIGAAANATSLGRITLLGGDLNQDNVINIFDLAHVANNFKGDDALSDLNADGQVNILDLALVAGNYQQHGPLTNWVY